MNERQPFTNVWVRESATTRRVRAPGAVHRRTPWSD